MNEIENIKDEIISIYNLLKNNLSEDTIPPLEHNSEDNNNNSYIISLIKNIKKIILNNYKNNDINEELLKNYLELENQIRLHENDIKYYIKQIMSLKIINTTLELKLNNYLDTERELEELKAKVKFEEGKFMENDRKDNEIIILRKENSKLKNNILYLEIKNKKYKNQILEYKEKIKNMENKIKNMNKKIGELERKINMKKDENKIRNIIINNKALNKSTSRRKLKTKIDNYNIFNFNINKIHDSRNKSNIYSPNNELFFLENQKCKSTNSLNNKVFDLTLSSIVNRINYKKLKIPFRKKVSNFLSNRSNKSTSGINPEIDDIKNILNKSNKHNNRNILKNQNKTSDKRKYFVKNIKLNES